MQSYNEYYLNEAISKYVYHVTFTKNVKKIQSSGLKPMQRSNWTKASTNKRYNEEGGVFGFEHPEDSWNWAFNMNWEFKQPISIIRLRRTKDWEIDPSQDINLTMGKGKALRSRNAISATNFIDSFNLNDYERNELIKELS